MFVRVSEIPVANTFNELVAMDFVDYGDYAALLNIQDAFSRFPAIISSVGKEEHPAEMARVKGFRTG